MEVEIFLICHMISNKTYKKGHLTLWMEPLIVSQHPAFFGGYWPNGSIGITHVIAT